MSAPADDATIPDGVKLWRRLFPKWVVRDEGGQRRITSAAFQNLPGHNALSVCVTCDAPPDFTPAAYVAEHPGYGVAAITVGAARHEGQGVVRVPEQGEVAHGHIVGDKSKKSVQRALAKAAQLLLDAPPLKEGSMLVDRSVDQPPD